MSTVLNYLHAHPTLFVTLKGIVWPILAGILLSIVRKHTAQEWKVLIGTTIGKKYPRLQGLLMIVESFAWVWEEAWAGIVQVLTGKFPIPDPPVATGSYGPDKADGSTIQPVETKPEPVVEPVVDLVKPVDPVKPEVPVDGKV